MIMLFIMLITGILLLCKLLCLVQESYYYYSYGYAYYRNSIIMHIVMLVAGILFLSFL